MKKVILCLALIIVSNFTFAAPQSGWNNNLTIEWLSYDNDDQQVKIKTTDGSLYLWSYVNSSESIIRSQIAMSMLMAAYLAGYEVDLWLSSSLDVEAVKVHK